MAGTWKFAGNVQFGQCGSFIDENKLNLEEIKLPCNGNQLYGGGRHAAMIGGWFWPL